MITFTKEIRNGKLHFLWSECYINFPFRSHFKETNCLVAQKRFD